MFPRAPGTPSTIVIFVVRPSLSDKSVPGVKMKGDGCDEFVFHHISLSSTSGGLISLSGRAEN